MLHEHRNYEIGGTIDQMASQSPVSLQTPLTGRETRGTRTTFASQNPSVSDDGARGLQDCESHRVRAAREHSGPDLAEIDTQDGNVEDRQPIRQRRASAPADLHGDLTSRDTLSGRVPGQVATNVNQTVIVYRRFRDLERARQRLVLQAMAICRQVCGGDKEAGATLYRKPDPATAVYLMPYMLAMEPLDAAIAAHEKELTRLGRALPVAAWMAGIAGLSPRFLAMIVGEAGRPITDYRSPACLWKRMGMAVIEGERQQRKSEAEAALAHGYSPQRRSLMWNVENSIMKQQVRKAEDGSRMGIGPYGEIYCQRRNHETEHKGEKYSHARAKRYMGKRLLRDMWRAWRDAMGSASEQEAA